MPPKNLVFGQHRMLLIGLLLTMLGGSAALNFLLYRQAKTYYFELNQTRLDPLGLAYYPISQTEAPTAQFRVVFFGDSRAASWTPPEVNGYEFINRGIPSQTSVQASQRFIAHVATLKPDLVIVQIGINDLKTIALFPERKADIIASCQANIQRIVTEARQTEATVILTTIFPTGNVPLARRPFWSDEIDRAIQEMNAYIATLADERTLVFDTFPVLADRNGVVLQQYQKDELHLNSQGYMALNQDLAQLISRIKP